MQHRQHHNQLLVGLVPGGSGSLEPISEYSGGEEDDETTVDCVYRRIDQQQLSFNVGFFNNKVRAPGGGGSSVVWPTQPVLLVGSPDGAAQGHLGRTNLSCEVMRV
jgi:hypothetical protein